MPDAPRSRRPRGPCGPQDRREPSRRTGADPEAAAQPLPSHETGARSRSVLCREVDVGRLDRHPARTTEAVEDKLARSAQESGLEAVDDLLHRDRAVPIDPAARLDIDRLARVEGLLEDVAIACLLYTSPSPRDRTRS